MKKIFLFLVFPFLSMFLSCSDDTINGNGGTTLKGTVLDKATQLPVSGAKVSFGDHETTSNSDGSYQISVSNIPKISMNLKVEKDNYAVYVEEVSITSGENEFDIELETIEAFCTRVKSVTYGGRIYNTVLIGDQCWFKDNLNVGTRLNKKDEAANNGIIEKYCYSDFVSNCDEFGGLYTWGEAVQYITAGSRQGICPVGWYIPSENDFRTLIEFVGYDGNALMDTVSWRPADPSFIGTNTSGFSALAAGVKAIQMGYLGKNGWAGFCTSTLSSDTDYYNLWLDADKTNAIIIEYSKLGAASVRCLKE